MKTIEGYSFSQIFTNISTLINFLGSIRNYLFWRWWLIAVRKIIIIFFLSHYFLLPVISQDLKFNQSYCQQYSPVKHRVVDIMTSRESAQSIRIFSNRLADDTIKRGHYTGMRVAVFENGLIKENGQKITLPKGEVILDYQTDYLTTLTKSYDTHTSTLKRYKIINDKIELLKSKVFNHADIFFHSLGSGNILLTDDHEGQGRIFEIYASNLELVKAYIPFQKGFQQTAIDIQDEQLVIVTKPLASEDSIKITRLNIETASIISEQIIQKKDIRISNVYASKQMVLIYGNRKLLAIHQNGQIKWEKDLTILRGLLTVGTENLYVITKGNQLICFDIMKGNKLWQRNIFQEYLHPVETIVNGQLQKIAIPITLQTLFNGEVIGLIVGQVSAYSTIQNINYIDSEFYVFDRKGRLQTAINIEHEASTIKLINNSSDFKLITSTETYYYEKNN